MPKSHHDTLAVLVFLGSFFVGGFFLILARRRFGAAQLKILTDRAKDPVMVMAVFAGLVGSYYYAPIVPLWPIVLVLATTLFASYRIARLYAGQTHDPVTRGLLISGVGFQMTGPVVAVFLRAAA